MVVRLNMASISCTSIINLIIFTSLTITFVHSKSQLISLNEENWDVMLTGEWMVEFYAPWCPACKALQPVWEEFSSWSKDLNIKVGQVDVTQSPGLSGRFMVTALPTIFHVLNGEFRQYRGSREKDSFISFIEEDKWKAVDPIPGWKSPSSFQMSIVSYFFKMSQLLRAVHTRLMEDYGLPTWGSYLIFAVATIIVGALLGLLFSQVAVCTIDLLSPPKGVPPPSVKASHKDKGSDAEESDDDLAEEDIVDENTQDSNGARKRKARKAD